MSKLVNYLRLGIGGVLVLGGLASLVGVLGGGAVEMSNLMDTGISLGIGLLLIGDDLADE